MNPPSPPPRPDPPREGTDWHRPLLRELADLAMDAARRAHAQLADEPEPAAAAQAGLLFTRLARVVRQTIALDARLAASLHDDTAERARRARTGKHRHDQRRADLRRRLADAIGHSADPSDAESLLADLDDRLDDEDVHVALGTTPVWRILLDLCNEWGIKPNFASMTDEELDAAIAACPDAPATSDACATPHAPRHPP